MAITSVYELKSAHKEKHPNSHYFDPDTLKFFGESLSTMRVMKKTAKIKDASGEIHECYVLSKSSKKFNGQRVRTYGYFDIKTLEDIVV